MLGSWIIFAVMQAKTTTQTWSFIAQRKFTKGAGIFLWIYIYVYVLFLNSRQSIMGYLSLKTQLLWSPEAKWSNDLIKCGSPGVPVKYLAAFLNHILQDSAKSEDSPLHVWLQYLLNLRQFHSSRSTQIKASAFLFSPRLFLVLPLMLVVVLICPWEAPDQRADLEEVLKHNNPFPVSLNSCQHICIPSQTAAFYSTAALIL